MYQIQLILCMFYVRLQDLILFETRLNIIIFKSMEKYKMGSNLGDGAFGSVVKAIDQKNGRIVAIKKIKQSFNNWEQCQSLNEIKVLSKLHHPNIINLYELIKHKNQLYFVFQYMSRNVYQLIRQHYSQSQHIPDYQIRNIIYQTLQGLAYMHRHGYFHRDLKPQNLLELNGTIKIADFGLVRQIRAKPPFTQYVSTRWYRAPQVVLRARNYNSPMDIFAIGIIMAELYRGVPLCPGSNQKDQLLKILQITGTPSKQQWPQGYKLATNLGMQMPQFSPADLSELIPRASPQALSLINAMIQVNPQRRITAYQAVQHDYFQIKMPLSRPIQQKNVEIDQQAQQDWLKNIRYKPN